MTDQAHVNEAEADAGETVHYRPRGRVVPKQEIEAWQTGQAYLEAAKREAKRLRIESVKAYDQAKADGFQEGRKGGAEATARLLAETAIRADRHLAEADGEIVDLAIAVVRQVLGEFDEGQLVRNAVRHALSRQRQDQHLTLHVAPDMVTALRADVDDQFEPGMRHLITVEPDPRLGSGQCRLASEVGFVDLDIDAQLKAIHRGLADGLARQAAGQD